MRGKYKRRSANPFVDERDVHSKFAAEGAAENAEYSPVAETPGADAAAGEVAEGAQPAPRPRRAGPFRIMVVDDHPVVRRGVCAILESQPGMEVCAECADGDVAIALAKREKPDLIVLDLTLPSKNGLEVTISVREANPDTEVLVLSMHFSDELAREVLRCGALGYMLKSNAEFELLAAVDHMRHRQPFFTARLAATMAQKFVNGEPDDDGSGTQLTDRETQVVQMLAEGKSNKEVAGILGVSTRTVESHRNHIMRKMNFTSFSELIRYAVRVNLVGP